MQTFSAIQGWFGIENWTIILEVSRGILVQKVDKSQFSQKTTIIRRKVVKFSIRNHRLESSEHDLSLAAIVYM